MDRARVRLGELLVAAGVVSSETIELALERQKQDGRRLGVILVEGGFVDETTIVRTLSQQLSAPWVSLYHVDFSRRLLNLVPREVAEKYTLVPVHVRHVRRQGNTLYVAIADPTNEEAIAAASLASGLPVRAMIAGPTEIRRAIGAYYADAPPESLGAADELPSEHEEEEEPVSVPPPSPPRSVPAPSDETPEIEAHELPRKSSRARMITLTMLDGTTLTLPARRLRHSNRPPPSEHEPEPVVGPREGDTQLTARDLIAALRAVTKGTDASEVLGDNARWEAVFAALLSVLLKKHLIADWEFIEELKKI